MTSTIDSQNRRRRAAVSATSPRDGAPASHGARPHLLDPEDFAAHSFIEQGSFEVQVAHELFASHHEEARAYAERLRRLAMLWDDADEEGDTYALLVADARRVTVDRARTLLRDAAIAVTSLPRTLERLEARDIPVSWFELLLRRVRRLTPDQCWQLDDRVADWDLANLRSDRFSRELGEVVTWFGTTAVHLSPEEQRDVELAVDPENDGTARPAVTGPIHEIIDLSHCLDAAARAVQDEQRHALADGRPAPFDIDGAAARDGHHLTLAALRYAVLTRPGRHRGHPGPREPDAPAGRRAGNDTAR